MPVTPSGAKKPQDKKAKASRHGSSWRSPYSDLDLPSGETCRVRRPGIQGLIKAGVLHGLDSLTSIVQTETIPTAEGKPKVDIKAILDDSEKFGSMMTMVDKIVNYVVVEPSIVSSLRPVINPESGLVREDANGEPILEEIPDAEREPELVYDDYIDVMDKMYIMNYAVGGSADLAKFREATQDVVGSVSDGETTAKSTK